MLMWWKSAVNLRLFLSLATFRMRSNACDTLPRLRCGCLPRGLLHGGLHRFVRRLRSYYDGVRLLVPVHHRPRLLAFPMRTAGLGTHHSTTTARQETSQVPM